MDLRFSSEQVMLKESGEAFVRDYLSKQRAASIAEAEGFSWECWRSMVELGWLAASLPESAGGLGGTLVESMIIHEAAGAGLIVEPLLAAELAAGLMDLVATEDQRQALLPPLLEGELLVAIAHLEDAGRGDAAYIEAVAKPAGNGWVLSGRKSLVVGALAAHSLVISAQLEGLDDIGLFIVGRERLAGRLIGCKTIDHLRAADVVLEGLQVTARDILDQDKNNRAAVVEICDRAVVLDCAEAVGAMDAVLCLTADYLKTRRQFGVPIGSFQALQHKFADMVVALELAKSMLLAGVAALMKPDPIERARGVSAAKVRIAESAKLIGGHAVQLHGAIGVTEEYILSNYFRRLTVFANRFGGLDYHLARFASS